MIFIIDLFRRYNRKSAQSKEYVIPSEVEEFTHVANIFGKIGAKIPHTLSLSRVDSPFPYSTESR